MKKWILLALCLLVLTGCGQEKAFETVGDVYAPQTLRPMELQLTLPPDAAVGTMQGEGGKLYFCDGYTVTTQILPGGNLGKTLREVTGYGPERLTTLETEKEGIACHSCVWTAVGEGGDQMARTVILDDGCFHYAVTAMADSALAGQLAATWQAIFQSVKILEA